MKLRGGAYDGAKMRTAWRKELVLAPEVWEFVYRIENSYQTYRKTYCVEDEQYRLRVHRIVETPSYYFLYGDITVTDNQGAVIREGPEETKRKKPFDLPEWLVAKLGGVPCTK